MDSQNHCGSLWKSPLFWFLLVFTRKDCDLSLLCSFSRGYNWNMLGTCHTLNTEELGEDPWSMPMCGRCLVQVDKQWQAAFWSVRWNKTSSVTGLTGVCIGDFKRLPDWCAAERRHWMGSRIGTLDKHPSKTLNRHLPKIKCRVATCNLSSVRLVCFGLFWTGRPLRL